MWYEIDGGKMAVRDHSVFAGLDADPLQWVPVFTRADHYLVNIHSKRGLIGHAVFQILGGQMVFKLINCQPQKNAVTAALLNDFVYPFCMKHGLTGVVAQAEREGMAKRLKAMGFKKLNGNFYRLEVL